MQIMDVQHYVALCASQKRTKDKSMKRTIPFIRFAYSHTIGCLFHAPIRNGSFTMICSFSSQKSSSIQMYFPLLTILNFQSKKIVFEDENTLFTFLIIAKVTGKIRHDIDKSRVIINNVPIDRKTHVKILCVCTYTQETTIETLPSSTHV